MGKQVGLHILAEDCKAFLDFVQGRDPVVIFRRDSKVPEIEEIHLPLEHGGTYCLWNQTLRPSIERTYIPESINGPYYRVDSSLPVVEFSYPFPLQEPWNGKPALTQGRIWAGFESENKEFNQWYNAIARWIRKNFKKNPVPLLGGYVGPRAHEWYKGGGVLLPMLRPPITPQWLSWVEAQDQHRAVFSN